MLSCTFLKHSRSRLSSQLLCTPSSSTCRERSSVPRALALSLGVTQCHPALWRSKAQTDPINSFGVSYQSIIDAGDGEEIPNPAEIPNSLREKRRVQAHRVLAHLHLALAAVVQQDQALGGPVQQGSSDRLRGRALLRVNVPEQPQQGLEQHGEPAGHPARETAPSLPQPGDSTAWGCCGAGSVPGQPWTCRNLGRVLGMLSVHRVHSTLV